MPSPIDPKTGLPIEEEGIREEGLFDVLRPLKEKAIEKVQEVIPSKPAGKLTAKALDILIPDSPAFLLSKAGEGADTLRSVVQKGVRAPKEIKAVREGEKVFGRPKATSAYEVMTDRNAVEESKRQALEFLNSLGIEPPRRK